MAEPEPPDKNVTLWIQALHEGEDEVAADLWEYCFPRLLRYSRSRLPENLRKALDEEDVALSTFKSLYRNAKRGALQQVQSRDELWKLLTCIAARKVSGYIRHETRKKRGGGQVRGESIFQSADEIGSPGIQQTPDRGLDPEMAAEFDDRCQELLEMLGDDTLKTIALLRMEGYTVDEIAERVGCAKRSVERRITLIRKTWESESQ